MEKLKQPGGRKELWDEWFKAQGCWSRVMVSQRRKIVKKFRVKDTWGFRTKQQMLEMHNQDHGFVNKLCAEKTG